MTTGRLLAATLQGLADGRISSEEAVRSALSGPAALESLLARASRRGLRRPSVRPFRQLPEAIADAAVQLVKRRLGRTSNVTSVHWGVARTRGRRTEEAGVVVHVNRKLSRRMLRSRRQKAAPPHVVVRHRGRRFKVRVDVQAVKVPARGQQILFVEPADHAAIRQNGEAIGSLGAIAPGPNGPLAITVGHVAGIAQPGDVLDCFDDEAGAFPIGDVRINRFFDGIDIAAIGPVPQVPPDAVLDLTGVRDVTSSDTNHLVRVRVPGVLTPIETHIDDINATRSFSTPLGPITMSGLTAIGRVTEPGDSGAPTVDEDDILIGFVVGADALHTYLLPARRALDAIEAAL